MELGFFLILDGFDLFGNLPDNLSLVTLDGGAANIEAGQPVFLQSATAALLNGATIFHSFAALNHGGAEQVLSGVAPSSRELIIGFEDSRASSDNHFQDVVVAIQVTNNGALLLPGPPTYQPAVSAWALWEPEMLPS